MDCNKWDGRRVLRDLPHELRNSSKRTIGLEREQLRSHDRDMSFFG